MTKTRSNERRLELTSLIVSAYLSRNVISPVELPHLIRQTYSSLGATSEHAKAEPSVEVQRPAIPITKSVTDDFIVCLEDGKKFKSLKRHLMAKYALTPEQYRERWKLPAEYPMVAPNYARQRSELARASGLGKNTASTPLDPPASGRKEMARSSVENSA